MRRCALGSRTWQPEKQIVRKRWYLLGEEIDVPVVTASWNAHPVAHDRAGPAPAIASDMGIVVALFVGREDVKKESADWWIGRVVDRGS